MTHTIDARQMTSQVLDSMDLEREKGITIKARAVRLEYQARDGKTYGLNLIDTPGTSTSPTRSATACRLRGRHPRRRRHPGHRGPDLANVHLALRENLTLIPVLNKIDLPSADPDTIIEELENVLAIPREEVILAVGEGGHRRRRDPRGDRRAHPGPNGDPARRSRA
jgi:GTP-binding protein LepA